MYSRDAHPSGARLNAVPTSAIFEPEFEGVMPHSGRFVGILSAQDGALFDQASTNPRVCETLSYLIPSPRGLGFPSCKIEWIQPKSSSKDACTGKSQEAQALAEDLLAVLLEKLAKLDQAAFHFAKELMHFTELSERWESGRGIVLRKSEYVQDMSFCLKLTDPLFLTRFLVCADVFPDATKLAAAKARFKKIHTSVLAKHRRE